ncbi:MAG TPA: uracil-DNA glycosylase [Hyphomonadaceae bacterium]|nr:uracil-DNA glycosylase [Hyphomonadaceae bacterium]
MTDSRPDLALKALAEFWADMGLEEARALTIPRPAAAAAQRPSFAQPRQAERPPGSPRPEPRRLNNNPVADARRLAMAATTLGELRTAVERFNGCPLKQAAKNTVVCDGAFDAEVMIVGEAPGGDEDIQGLPFVGRAGKLLDKMLAAIGLSRQTNVYITNLVYWRPPGNRDPSTAEMQVCAPFLQRQIELKAPRLLLTAGKFATQAMLGSEDGIMRLRGRKLRYTQEGLPKPIPCIPLLHPAYLLRRPEDKAKAWDDLRVVATLCDELGVKREGAL